MHEDVFALFAPALQDMPWRTTLRASHDPQRQGFVTRPTVPLDSGWCSREESVLDQGFLRGCITQPDDVWIIRLRSQRSEYFAYDSITITNIVYPQLSRVAMFFQNFVYTFLIIFKLRWQR